MLKLIWGRLDELQRKSAVRWALTALFAVVVIGYFGAVWSTTKSIQRDGQAILDVLRPANLAQRDEVAVQFAEKGTVSANGRTFGGERYAQYAKTLFNAEGRIADPNAAARMLLQEHTPSWAPAFLLNSVDNIVILAIVALILLELAVWVGLSVPLLTVALVTTVMCWFLALFDAKDWVVAVASIAALLFCFALLVRAMSNFLGRATPVFAIASTVLREAVRLKIATFFVGVLLVAIPLLPITISRTEPLRYQIQTFISRSMGLMFLLAACMTIFLACATVAFEIRDKQIWQLMTKPVARFQYLLGKWLGVVALNLILCFLGGVAIFTYVQYMHTRPSKDPYDAMAVREEVLVARQGCYPTYRKLTADEARKLVEDAIDADPLLRADIDNKERSETEVKRELARDVHRRYLAEQRTINPGKDGERTYVFEGLSQAKKLNAILTLRYAFDIGRIDPHEVHPVIFRLANGQNIARDFVPGQSHVLQIRPEAIDDKGNFEVTVINGAAMRMADGTTEVSPGIGMMIFKPDAFEVLFRVDSFEWNFLRALLVQILKLSFLAMFGVCAATVLSFPVACVLTFTVLSIGALGPFLGMSINEYYVKPDAPILLKGVQYAIKGVASASEWMLRAFGETRPTALLVEGRVIDWAEVVRTLFVIGVVWTAAALALGYAAFRRKELATYSGHQ